MIAGHTSVGLQHKSAHQQRLMNSRFSGSTHSDDRRRRRLSWECADLSDEPVIAAFPEPQRIFAPADPGVVAPLRRVLSPQLWKHALLLSVLAVGIGSLVYHEFTADAQTRGGVHALTSRISAGLVGILLLLSGQLGLLTGWLRAQSSIDFQGRFRIWKWWSGVLIVAAVGILTGTTGYLPHVLAAMIEPLTGTVKSARPALMVLTVAGIVAVILGRLLPDMSRHRSAQMLLLSGLTLTALRSIMEHHASALSVTYWQLHAAELSAAFMTFAASLLHCRFVAYVCNAPPANANSRHDTRKAAVADTVNGESVASSKCSEQGPPADVPPMNSSSVADSSEGTSIRTTAATDPSIMTAESLENQNTNHWTHESDSAPKASKTSSKSDNSRSGRKSSRKKRAA